MSGPPEVPGGGAGAGYEELRARLATLGYLKRPLDRFVLSGIVRPGSFVRRHAAVSLRVALAAGPLLGILFALAVVVVNRPRFSRPLDFLLLGVYFSLAFGAAILLIEFAAGLALAAFVKWRGRGVAAFQVTAARAGFAISLLVSAYLAFWWRRRAGGGEGSWGFLLDALGLLVLVLVNAALLRVSSLASLAALVRVSDLPPVASREKGPGAPLLAVIGAALLAIGFLLAPGAPGVTAPSPFERIAVDGRLLVVAWDGAPAVGAPGAAAPDTGAPAPGFLARLAKPGGGGTESRPSYWTMVATGRPPAAHGVGEIEEKQALGISSPLGGNVPLATVLRILVPGRKVAVSAGVRRARAIWEIAGDLEGIGVVGWWATWPAAEAGSPAKPFAVVSDRALLSLQVLPAEERRVGPASLARELGIRLGDDLAAVRGEATALLGSLQAAPGLEQAALIDGYAVRAALKLAAEPAVRDLFVYLPGLDIVRSQGRELPGGGGPGAAAERERAYEAYARSLIGRLTAAFGPDDWVVVIADPGRVPSPPGSAPSVGGWVRISGPGTASPAPSGGDGDLESWDPLDVAPTLLNLRGLPRSREMEGQARLSFLAPAWRARLKPREIATYGENPVPVFPADETSSEEEILERLRSLGYAR